MSNEVEEFISKNWDNCIKNNRYDSGTLIGLPYPYIVPAVGHLSLIHIFTGLIRIMNQMCSNTTRALLILCRAELTTS